MQAEKNSSENLLPIVYDRLRNFAKLRLNSGGSIHGTDLVHEGYLRVANSKDWDSQAHFLGAVRNAMRNAIVDRLRKKSSVKHGGHLHRVEIENLDLENRADLPDVIALSDALDRLAVHDQRAANIVTLRFFACMSEAEISEELQISKRTIARDWTYAKAWLRDELV